MRSIGSTLSSPQSNLKVEISGDGLHLTSLNGQTVGYSLLLVHRAMLAEGMTFDESKSPMSYAVSGTTVRRAQEAHRMTPEDNGYYGSAKVGVYTKPGSPPLRVTWNFERELWIRSE